MTHSASYIMQLFKWKANRLGYTIKVTGDYCYKKSRRYDAPMLRLKQVTPQTIVVASIRRKRDSMHFHVDNVITWKIQKLEEERSQETEQILESHRRTQ